MLCWLSHVVSTGRNKIKVRAVARSGDRPHPSLRTQCQEKHVDCGIDPTVGLLCQRYRVNRTQEMIDLTFTSTAGTIARRYQPESAHGGRERKTAMTALRHTRARESQIDHFLGSIDTVAL